MKSSKLMLSLQRESMQDIDKPLAEYAVLLDRVWRSRIVYEVAPSCFCAIDFDYGDEIWKMNIST